MQLALSIFSLVWLIATPLLLYLIYRSTNTYIRKMEQTEMEGRAIASQAALKSAEVASRLAEMLETEHHA